MAPPKRILYLATEDWYFRSHYLPMARAAMADGFEVTLAARLGDAARDVAAAGIRTVPIAMRRGTLNPLSLVGESFAAWRLLRRERPDILHCLALKPILAGGLAAVFARVPKVVNSVNGLGFLELGGGALVTQARRLAWHAIALLLGRALAYTVVQNEHDARMLAGRSRNPITRIGGAGVDPAHYAELPPPSHEAVTAAVVSRMLWSKGIDTAVEAQRMLQRRGVMLELVLAGPVETGIPNALPLATLDEWGKVPGVRWLGAQADVRAIWREADIAVLASRGGEGLPRALLEASACGRPIVTTDVPGCRDLVRPGIEGLIVPPDDPPALAAALETLARDKAMRLRMGRAARARVLDGYTEQQVAEMVLALYRRLVSA